MSRKDCYRITFSVLVSALLSISQSYVGPKLETNRIKEIHLYFNLIGREVHSVFKRARLARQTKTETFRQSQKFDGQTCLFKDFDEKVLDFQVKERRKKNKHVFSNTNEEKKGWQTCKQIVWYVNFSRSSNFYWFFSCLLQGLFSVLVFD